MEYYVQNWQKAYDDTYKIAEQIRISKFVPDVIVGIARGGWIPARLLADFLHLKQTINVKIETYQMMGQEELQPDIQQSLSGSVKDKKVLIVDDVADSGTTLDAILKLVRQSGPKDVKIAVLYYKPKCIIKPDYFADITSKWILFSWSIFESIEEFERNWREDGLDDQKIQNRLKEIGLSPTVVNSYFEVNKADDE